MKRGAQDAPPGTWRLTAPERTFGSVEEFLDGLRQMQRATGTSFRTIERKSGGKLPHATAHRMVKPKRMTLPARAEQVGWFVTGCGGSAMDASFWLEQWRRLRSGRGEGRAARPLPRTDTPDPGTSAPVSRFETLPVSLPPSKTVKERIRRLVERRFAISIKGALAVILYTTLIVVVTSVMLQLFSR